MKRIGIGAFLANAIVYLAIVAFVFAVLYRDFVPSEMKFEAYGLTIVPYVYLVPLFYIALLVQRNMSAARGFGRFADWLISMTMLVIIGLAVASWAKLPFVEAAVEDFETAVGITFETARSDYKLAIVLIFGTIALADVLGRDILGIGRGGRTVSIGSDSAFEISAKPRIKLPTPWELELPGGHVVPFVPNKEQLGRFETEMRRRLPAPGPGGPVLASPSASVT